MSLLPACWHLAGSEFLLTQQLFLLFRLNFRAEAWGVSVSHLFFLKSLLASWHQGKHSQTPGLLSKYSSSLYLHGGWARIQILDKEDMSGTEQRHWQNPLLEVKNHSEFHMFSSTKNLDSYQVSTYEPGTWDQDSPKQYFSSSNTCH